MEWTTGVEHWTGLLECHAHKLVVYLGMQHNTMSFQAGVSIHWTGPLDWTTGLDYWTHL